MINRNVCDVVIMHHTMNNLYEFLDRNREFENWKSIEPDDEIAKKADYERRHKAWTLLAYLVNDMHGMGMIDENSRYGIIDMLDDVIIRQKAIDVTSPYK